ncbi:hypothetical protein QAD02_014714 [Eretmocerus hayati]|uniref:Uncharacterized protein n=1 Tax=Eretmocerus hayati TaxID=131215 RepID=A0ACC2P8Z1_9HYME|nr:hypothetical protein QAD02_014714 [Eretmocerus hayati]
MNSLVSIVFVFFVCAVYGFEIHKHLTDEERKAMFGARSGEMQNVKYKVLPVHHADTAKSKKLLQLQAFGRNISLYLEKNSHLLFGSATPIFLAKKKKLGKTLGDVEYTRYHYQLPENFKLYQDKENAAAVSAHKDKYGRTHFDGVVMNPKSNENLVIKPIPHRFHQELQSQYSLSSQNAFTNNFMKDLYNNHNPSVTHHVIVQETYGDKSNSFESLHPNFFNPNMNSIFSNSFTGSNVRAPSYNNKPGLAPSASRAPQYSTVQQMPGFVSPLPKNPQFMNLPTTIVNPQPSSSFAFNPAQPKTRFSYQSKSPGISKSTQNPGYPSMPSRNPVLPHNVDFSLPQNNFGMLNFQNFRPTNMNTDQMFGSPHTTVQKPAAWRPTNRDPITGPPKFGEAEYKPVPDSSISKTWPEAVYPEILVIVDHDTFEVHKKNLQELLKYLASFWNAVDLRYRELTKPTVRLNIAGLIIPEDPNATPYLDSHAIGKNDILVDPTLETMGEYFKNLANSPTPKLVDYDVALAITHRTLGSYDEYRNYKNSTAGLAYMRGACQVRHGTGVAIVKDSGGYNGIMSAVHELGHSLGAPHDGEESRNVPGGPCEWEDGYLMSYKVKDSRAFHWSRCSKTAMQEFFRSIDAKCLRNKPDPGKPYPKPLPGRLLSRDRQCELTIGLDFHASPSSAGDCAILNCTKVTETRYGNRVLTQTLFMVPNNSPAEGTSCGAKSICLDGKCVLDPDLLM